MFTTLGAARLMTGAKLVTRSSRLIGVFCTLIRGGGKVSRPDDDHCIAARKAIPPAKAAVTPRNGLEIRFIIIFFNCDLYLCYVWKSRTVFSFKKINSLAQTTALGKFP